MLQFIKNRPLLMSQKFIFQILTLLVAGTLYGQKGSVVFSGTIRDQQAGLALTKAHVTVFDDLLKKPITDFSVNSDGTYSVNLPVLTRYRIVADGPTYFDQDTILTAPATGAAQVDLVLTRKPGYIFDITIFDKAFDHNPINTLRDCKIEIYNNTTREQELAIERLEKSTFNFAFAEGNHYTMLVRKPGYLNRRIELYVNVNGCILCVDGMGVKEPDLVPLMTNNNQTGFFLGTIDLDSIQIGKRFQLNNIYYDFDKWDIRSEAAVTLDKVATFLKDNPSIKVELGSHTDARGRDEYNLTLSDKRAESAVNYLVEHHGLDPERITHKGYGETQLANRCDDGVVCTEAEHQQNRRTEIKITGLTDRDPLWDKSLKQIIEDPQLYRKVIEQEKRAKSLSSKLR
jgi:outer membrane protein OmpA-like peptidoglycan-associated protein